MLGEVIQWLVWVYNVFTAAERESKPVLNIVFGLYLLSVVLL